MVQVFLVAGGYDAGYNPLSSTELLVESSDAWTMSTPLPRAVDGLRGATLGNIVYMTGGSYCYCIMSSVIIICNTGGTDDNARQRSEILAWSEERN